MKRFAIAAAVLAVCSVSIAIAQLQEQAAEPDDAKLPGVFSVLKVGDWVTVDLKRDRPVLTMQRFAQPETIRRAYREFQKLSGSYVWGKQDPSAVGDVIARVERETGIPFDKYHDLYEVKQLSSDHVTLSNDQHTVHIPASSIGYVDRYASSYVLEPDPAAK